MTEYRYPHFDRGLLREDSSFAGGPSPGEPLPDFDLPTTRGGRVSKRDFLGRTPFMLTFASFT